MPKLIKEVIGELGIPAEDVRDIGLGAAEALERLLTDRELRECFRAKENIALRSSFLTNILL